jgi:hypothetical protein
MREMANRAVCIGGTRMVMENAAERGAKQEQRYQRCRHHHLPNYASLSHFVEVQERAYPNHTVDAPASK